MTLCQTCDKNPATIHFTHFQDGVKRELHVCETCANEQGLAAGVVIPPMLAGLVEGARRPAGVQDLACPECGITFEEFRNRGRFGCPHDYTVFAEALGPLLDKIHGARVHQGRLPRGFEGRPPDLGDRLLRMRRALQEAVDAERYEEAARLRDEILDAEGDRDAGVGRESSHGPR